MDAVNIVRLLKQGWSEQLRLEPARVNDAKALRYVLQHVEQSFVVVADLSGRLVGTLAVRPTEEQFSDDWYIEREWFYVVPSFHETPHRLLVEVEQYSEELELPLRMSAHSFSPERFDLLMSGRRRYVPMGSTFFRVPEAIDREEQVAATG